MNSIYIVLAFVGMAILSSAAGAWVVHLERVINPGDSVTIYCAEPEKEEDDNCDGLGLGGICDGGW